jgi:hypothetical protein
MLHPPGNRMWLVCIGGCPGRGVLLPYLEDDTPTPQKPYGTTYSCGCYGAGALVGRCSVHNCP